MTQVKVTVLLKDQVLDPQGKAVLGGLHALGFSNVSDVRQGKVFYLTLNAAPDSEEIQREVHDMSHKLLANPVIETFTIDILSGGKA